MKAIGAIRIPFRPATRTRDLALFNVAIDSRPGGCDLVWLRQCELAHGGRVGARAMVVQRKTRKPVRFELADQTRDALEAWTVRDFKFSF